MEMIVAGVGEPAVVGGMHGGRTVADPFLQKAQKGSRHCSPTESRRFSRTGTGAVGRQGAGAVSFCSHCTHDLYSILHRATARLITLFKSRFDGTHGSPERTWIAPVRVELEHLVI